MATINKTKIERKLQRKTNPQLRELIIKLKKQKDIFWLQVARELAKPRKRNKGVSLFKINKASTENDTIIVPGKVLASGKLEKKVRIVAFNLSQGARQAIEKNGSKLVKFGDIIKEPIKNFKIVN